MKLSIAKHFLELKTRVRNILIFYICFFVISYFFKENLYLFILSPIKSLDKIIYTSLAEAFFSYLKLSALFAFVLTIPVINWHLYFFVAPALFTYEKKTVTMLLVFSLCLFILGFFFVFLVVMPNLWSFFLSFENSDYSVPLVLQPKISEYVSLVTQFVCAFGIIFQIPILFVILSFFSFVDSFFLAKFRKIAIVISFIFGAILTPPDIFSQFCLAIPIIVLYELSIAILRYLEKIKNVKY